MNEIVTEPSEGVLRVELNRPAKRNAITSSMYLTLADVMIEAAKDEHTRVVLWHGDDAKEAFNAFLEERPPDFTRTMKSASAAYAGAVA